MKVFISWSGDRSKAVAIALREFIPDVIQKVVPWMSEMDIGAGERWSDQIDKELIDTKFGIICLTPENANEPWINFEAGAIAKSVDQSTYVCPYLFGMTRTLQVPEGPLSKFQAKLANIDHTWDLIKSINSVMGKEGLEESRLRKTFNRFWPDLDKKLQSIPKKLSTGIPKRPEKEMIEEILELVRGISISDSKQVEMVQGLLQIAKSGVELKRSYGYPNLIEVLNQSPNLHVSPDLGLSAEDRSKTVASSNSPSKKWTGLERK